MLSSQANPINRRFLSNNLGTPYVNDLPSPNQGLAFFKVKLRTQFTFNNLFDLTEYDPYSFGDYLGAYAGYDYNNWLYSTAYDGFSIPSYGIIYETAGGELMDAATGALVPAGEVCVIDISSFAYDIKNIVWGYNYQTGSRIDVGISYPFSIQAFPYPWQKTLKNNNKAFHKYYQQ